MLGLFRYHNKAEKDLARYINNVFGFYPRNITLYQLAFTHKSVGTKKLNGITISNERLEYLGDAILSSIVAEYLFKKYPLYIGTLFSVFEFPYNISDRIRYIKFILSVLELLQISFLFFSDEIVQYSIGLVSFKGILDYQCAII